MPTVTTLASKLSDVTDVLSKDQKEHRKELDRFHFNIKALQKTLRHELQTISARFNIKNSIASLDPIDIGYFVRDLQHVSIEKRKYLECAECRYLTMDDTQPDLPALELLEWLCEDGLTVENCRVEHGVGLLHIDLKRAKAYVRVMSEDFKASEDVPYPFLIVSE